MRPNENVGVLVSDQQINRASFEPVNRGAHDVQCGVVDEFTDIKLAL